MGASASQDEAPLDAGDELPPPCGYRVLSVEGASPGATLLVMPDARAAREGLRSPRPGALVAYLDVLASVNGIELDGDALEADVLAREVAANVGSPIILEVYNVKRRRFRTVQLTPERAWGGDGLLGVQVRRARRNAHPLPPPPPPPPRAPPPSQPPAPRHAGPLGCAHRRRG